MPDLYADAEAMESAIQVIETYFENNWTEGFPIVPPTQPRVRKMMEASGRDPDEELGEVPPRMGVATVKTVAINAVMAGCKPEYFPVVLAAVEAALDPPFNLNGIQATTNAVSPLMIVSGPIVKELNINSGVNCFGHGYRANATIGRALRLVMVNLGGGHPETGDKAGLGQPGKYSFCIGESPDTPWEPIHVEHGLRPDDSAVTLFGCTGPIPFAGRAGEGAEGILWAYARSIIDQGKEFALRWGGQMGVTITPFLAGELAKKGWTKRDFQWFLYEKARMTPDEAENYSPGYRHHHRGTDPERWPIWIDVPDPNLRIPLIRKPENYVVSVCGSTWVSLLPGWGFLGGYATTRLIRRP